MAFVLPLLIAGSTAIGAGIGIWQGEQSSNLNATLQKENASTTSPWIIILIVAIVLGLVVFL
jgi:hypothetical protein